MCITPCLQGTAVTQVPPSWQAHVSSVSGARVLTALLSREAEGKGEQQASRKCWIVLLLLFILLMRIIME